MKTIFNSVLIFLQFFIYTTCQCSEMTKHTDPDPLGLNSTTRASIYKDFLGEKDGIYRDLININGKPALYASSSSDMYFTLNKNKTELLIDCIYVEARSNTNGVSIKKGICGLDKKLSKDYLDLGFSYSNQWQEETSKIDINQILKENKPLTINVGHIENIGLYRKYNKIDDLENNLPIFQIRNTQNNKCHRFLKGKIFVLYEKSKSNQPQYVEVWEENNIIKTKKFDKSELSILAQEECDKDIKAT